MLATTQTRQKKKISLSDEITYLPDTIYNIDLSKIVPSPFEPQNRRRKRFKEADIESLGSSLLQQGQISPILVRSVLGAFEIVYGERRFLAALKVNLGSIKTFVRELADAEVIELQYQENHQRQENNPLDDAFTFKYLQEKENLSISQLADKFGTSQRNVADKLKLNDLIPEAVKQLEDGHLPLRHAYYLAKFPSDAQKEIVENFLAYRYGDIDEGAIPFDEFKEEIEENTIRRLTNAPFDPNDTRLHIKGLVCPACPERTGFEKLLFPELEKEDSCLNKSCFEIKTNTHLRLKRDEIAEKLPNPENLPIKKIVEKVPIVTSRSWATEDDTPFKVKPLTSQTFLENLECISSEPALIADGERKGQETFICRDKSCDIHFPKEQKAGSDETPEWKLKQMEDDFNRKVSQEVRRRVFAKAMEFFNDNKVFWIFADLVAQLITEFLAAIGSIQKDRIFELVKDWKNAPANFNDKKKILEFALSLDVEKKSRLLFLLAHREDLVTDYQNFECDERIRDICAGYGRGLKFQLLDAEIRLELAPDEFKPVAGEYYRRISDSDGDGKAEPPHFWYKEPEETSTDS